jgi:thiamine biosynthesis protein ThiS
MTILVNGESTSIHGAATVADLVDRYQLPPRAILIEHNGLALHRHEWSARSLAEGDNVEFVRVVAGG